MAHPLVLRTDLERLRCSDPSCTEDHGPLWLHSECHPEAPTWVAYEQGELTVTCAECDAHVVTIAVAG